MTNHFVDNLRVFINWTNGYDDLLTFISCYCVLSSICVVIESRLYSVLQIFWMKSISHWKISFLLFFPWSFSPLAFVLVFFPLKLFCFVLFCFVLFFHTELFCFVTPYNTEHHNTQFLFMYQCRRYTQVVFKATWIKKHQSQEKTQKWLCQFTDTVWVRCCPITISCTKLHNHNIISTST